MKPGQPEGQELAMAMTGDGDALNVSGVEDARPCPQAEVYDYPDAWLPLYRSEVKRATGVSAETLLKCVLADADQYGPGVVRANWDGSKHHWRFNPARYVRYLESKEVAARDGERQDRQSTGSATDGGSGGPTGKEGRSARPSLTGTEPTSRTTSTRMSPAARSGSAALAARILTRKKKSE